jgi:hypothetical protein
VRQAPTAPARVIGYRFDRADKFEAIYYGATSDFAELGDACWHRDRATCSAYSKEVWHLKIRVCGRSIYVDAVIDDFGNLVAVDQ